MTPHQFHILNSKIDKFGEDLRNYIADDMAWKKEASDYREKKTDPMVQTYASTSGFVTTLKAVLGFLVLVGAGVAAVFTIKNKLHL